jgi:protocatechuate 3,4-dioxygenase beta subunit
MIGVESGFSRMIAVASGFLVRRSAWREGGSWTLLVLTLSGVVTVAQQPTAPAMLTVSGVVMTANDAPLPRVRVAIPAAVPAILAGSYIRLAPTRVVLTDNDGRFTIHVAASSTTVLQFSKARYITQTTSISPRELSAGASGLRVRLPLGGAISGQVIDRGGGGPLVSATVTLRRVEARQADAPLATTRTNDLGEYRFGGLAPGRYVATATPSVTALGADFPDRQKVIDAAAAQGPPVEVGAGSDVGNVVLTVDMPSEMDAGAGNRPNAGPDATASISGRVVGVDGRPISRAVVHAFRPYIAGRQVETDQSGRYRIDRLVPGDYTIAVRKYGFESREYGQEIGSAAGRSITLKNGQSVAALDVTLLRGGAITGTILDEFGEPMQDVAVSAVQLQPNPGGARGIRAASRGGGRTDDRGQYRLSGLFPGSYFVQAVAEGDLTAGTGYLPRLYPGVMAFDQATQTRVDFGSEITGIDFAVSATETYRVTGRVWDASGNVAQGSVSLTVSERSGAVQTQARSANIGPDGSFEFTNVGPGEYVVQASAASRVPITSGRPTTTSIQFAMSYVTIRGSEPPPVDLRLTPGATLIGRVRYENLPQGPSPLLTIETLGADRDRTSVLFSGSQSADVQPDGSFEVLSVFGPTLLKAQPQRSDWYLKSVLFRGQDLVDTPVDFGVNTTVRGIEVVISTTGATVTGRVTDDRGAVVRDYAVLVFPTFRDQWFAGSRWVKSLRARSVSVPFVVTGLPPGDYWVAAIDPPDLGNPIADPDLLESVSSRATRITLGEGQTQDVSLHLIRR